jgi:Anti-sigma factor NepR
MEQTTRFFVSIATPGLYRPARRPQEMAECQGAETSGPGVQGESALSSEKAQKPEMTRKAVGKKVHSKDQDMGAALRSVYQKTVEENVPSEMLDLLSKLG